jgi:predicted ester cyclase
MSEANKQLVRRHFEELFNHQHLAVAEELVAREYLEHAVAPFGQAEPGKVNGPAAMRQTVGWLLAQFPDLHMTIEAIVAEGDTVAVRIRSEGTNLGALNGVVSPTGKRFAARQSHWFRVQDGRLAEHWATREDLVAMLQLGVVQPPGLALRPGRGRHLPPAAPGAHGRGADGCGNQRSRDPGDRGGLGCGWRRAEPHRRQRARTASHQRHACSHPRRVGGVHLDLGLRRTVCTSAVPRRSTRCATHTRRRCMRRSRAG